jgi:hypothetical protein
MSKPYLRAVVSWFVLPDALGDWIGVMTSVTGSLAWIVFLHLCRDAFTGIGPNRYYTTFTSPRHDLDA